MSSRERKNSDRSGKNGRVKRRKRVQYHRRSILAICGILFLLVAVVSISSFALRSKSEAYVRQEQELKTQLEEEKKRSEEIDGLKEYIGTDEYVEQVAKDRLGLIHENEVILKAK